MTQQRARKASGEGRSSGGRVVVECALVKRDRFPARALPPAGRQGGTCSTTRGVSPETRATLGIFPFFYIAFFAIVTRPLGPVPGILTGRDLGMARGVVSFFWVGRRARGADWAGGFWAPVGVRAFRWLFALRCVACVRACRVSLVKIHSGPPGEQGKAGKTPLSADCGCARATVASPGGHSLSYRYVAAPPANRARRRYGTGEIAGGESGRRSRRAKRNVGCVRPGVPETNDTMDEIAESACLVSFPPALSCRIRRGDNSLSNLGRNDTRAGEMRR